jgi:hypothetical protein
MKRRTAKPENVPAAPALRIEFKAEERNYIVDNVETDLLLTEVGMRLVEGPRDVPARSKSEDLETLDINPVTLVLRWPLRTATAHGPPSLRLCPAAPLR